MYEFLFKAAEMTKEKLRIASKWVGMIEAKLGEKSDFEDQVAQLLEKPCVPVEHINAGWLSARKA